MCNFRLCMLINLFAGVPKTQTETKTYDELETEFAEKGL